MFAIVKRFFWDEAYASQMIRAALLALSMGLGTGAIDLGTLNEHLGAVGWWLSPILAFLAGYVRSGDKNPLPGASS